MIAKGIAALVIGAAVLGWAGGSERGAIAGSTSLGSASHWSVVAAGPNEYSAPEWFPLRGDWVIGCTWNNGCANGYHGYAAIDIARNPSGSISGDPVYAAGSGLATIYSTTNGCGNNSTFHANAVRIDHGNNTYSYYYHLDHFAISAPTWVDANTVIGYVGHTGQVDPCSYNHLHFEVHHNGVAISPGQLKACIGSRLTTYPAELGKSDWPNVPLWSHVQNDGTGCATGGGGGALSIATPLALSAPGGLKVFQPLTFSFAVQNVSGGGASIQRIEVAVRDPNGQGVDRTCDGGTGLTLAAGQQWTCSASATTGYGSAGTYTYWADWLDYGGHWHTGELGPNQTFTLQGTGQPLATAQPLSLSAPGGLKVFQPLTFSFAVQNVSGGGASIQRIEVAVRDPNGQPVDRTCDGGTGLTLVAGQQWTCTASATTGYGSAGTYTYWADWLDYGGHWHTGELGPNQTFTLQEGGQQVTAPGAPTNVAAVAGNTMATISWTPPTSNGGSPITGYTVSASPGAITATIGPIATSADVSGLTNGVTYTFRVSAKNTFGTGAPSAASNPVTPVAPPLLPKVALTVVKSGTGGGMVTSNIGGITCGVACAADFDPGLIVSLSAAPSGNAAFVGWGGPCSGIGSCTLTMDSAKTVTATFNQVLKPAVSCVVPNVKGKLLATAKRKIAARHCRTGKVTKAKSKKVAKGKVISQTPRVGRKLASGSKVNLIISRGTR